MKTDNLLGRHVEVYATDPLDPNRLISTCVGMVQVIGDGRVVVETTAGAQHQFKLANSVLQPMAPQTIHVQAPANMPRIPAIRNHATGSGFRRYGGKLHFDKSSRWTPTPTRHETVTGKAGLAFWSK